MSEFRGTGPQGHRARMRARVLAAGAGSLADYEALEMLLFFGIPRRDTKPLAKALINQFGSLFEVLRAPGSQLRAAGLSDDAIRAIRLPAIAAERLASHELRARPFLGDWDHLLTYLDIGRSGAIEGQLRVLFLDNRNHLIADEAIEDGAVAEVAQAVMRRALTLHATALIGLEVTRGDLQSRAEARSALAGTLMMGGVALSIALHDVMIVGRGEWISLRQDNLF